ncbi:MULTISPECIES: DinB family protein [Chitinophaga]|uniref:DinB family protein n=1 Tax=Chitinophaga TaxID=79328 RepID=UPI001159F1A4|nr:DinB family protein [Chitinophaga polysaccharea]
METNKAAVLLEQFNKTIDIWINHLNDYTLDMLRRKPGENSWSLGQVYLHIIEDTAWFVEQMHTCLLLSNANSEKEMHEDAKAIFANNAFPDALMENPSNDPDSRQPKDKEELLQGLTDIKEEVNALYSVDHPQADGKTEHPGLHFFNLLEWLQFAEMHMRHHLRQKQRIDEKLFR